MQDWGWGCCKFRQIYDIDPAFHCLHVALLLPDLKIIKFMHCLEMTSKDHTLLILILALDLINKHQVQEMYIDAAASPSFVRALKLTVVENKDIAKSETRKYWISVEKVYDIRKEPLSCITQIEPYINGHMFCAGREHSLAKLSYLCKFVLGIAKYPLTLDRLTKYVNSKLDIRKIQVGYIDSRFSF
jgi:hypothetical protein